MTTKTMAVTITKNAGGDAAFVLSAGTPDRVGDTIAASAYREIVSKAGRVIALWQHRADQPVGFWQNLRADGGRLLGELKLASTQLGAMIKQLLDADVPLSASIGFRGTGKPNATGGTHYEKIELLEVSVVSVPAHPEAVRIAKAFGFDLQAEGDAGSAADAIRARAAESLRRSLNTLRL